MFTDFDKSKSPTAAQIIHRRNNSGTPTILKDSLSQPRTLPSVDRPPKGRSYSISAPKEEKSRNIILKDQLPSEGRRLPTSESRMPSLQQEYPRPPSQVIESSPVLNLSHMTSLGEPDPTQIHKYDILSSLSFDAFGNKLAVGDYGGRCIIF